MDPKMPRPAARGGAHRAAISELLGEHSNQKNITIHPQTLALALQRGATLYVGPRHADYMTDRDEIERILRGDYPFAHAQQIDSLIVAFAYCWHFLLCAGRSHQYNHKYPVSRLRDIIAECFGLRIDDVPALAVLAALRARCATQKRCAVAIQRIGSRP